MTTFARLLKLLQKQLPAIDPSAVTTRSHLSQDLHADALDMSTLIMLVDEEFGVELDDAAMDSSTVGDVLAFIQRATGEPLDEPAGGIHLDHIQQETERLLSLLRDRQPGDGAWQTSLYQRFMKLRSLTDAAIGVPISQHPK
ncbi:MAG: acyl carrier protein [Candidatus Kerfeldbacteria bacterium]|nr:acyl carrier protein [Candidatus Kerfeldbacteria bacterium]